MCCNNGGADWYRDGSGVGGYTMAVDDGWW